MTRSWRRIATWIGLLLPSYAYSHVVSLDAAQGRFIGDAFVLTISVPLDQAAQLLPDLDRQRASVPADFHSFQPAFAALGRSLWEVRIDGSTAPPIDVGADLLQNHEVSFRLSYLRLGGRKIVVRALNLHELPKNLREVVTIQGQEAGQYVQKVLSTSDDTLAFEVTEWGELVPKQDELRGPENVLLTFIWMGIEHIWTGYDHLLFLFGLLVVCRRFRSIVSIVSCFTLAHSLTLALATLGIVHLPARLTEPAIAATIVFVSLENILRRGAEPPGRWALTFAFGLIHGFGFASVLRDLGVGANGQSIAMPLFAFNFGVEIGQIAIAAIVLPILWQLRTRPVFVRIGVPVLSAIAAMAGFFWLIQRTLFA